MSFLGMNLHLYWMEWNRKHLLFCNISIWFGKTFKIIRNRNNLFAEFYGIKYLSKNDNVNEIMTMMTKIFGLKYLNIFTHEIINNKLHIVEFPWAYQESHIGRNSIFFNKIWATEKCQLKVSINSNSLMIKYKLEEYCHFINQLKITSWSTGKWGETQRGKNIFEEIKVKIFSNMMENHKQVQQLKGNLRGLNRKHIIHNHIIVKFLKTNHKEKKSQKGEREIKRADFIEKNYVTGKAEF